MSTPFICKYSCPLGQENGDTFVQISSNCFSISWGILGGVIEA